jgi:hypothetical protein
VRNNQLSKNRRTIDFLGIGGHACGSTKLYQLMKAHPQIGFVHRSKEAGVDIRGKECHYWDRYSERPIEWYLSYFQWSFPRVGEITPAYARLDEATVAKVASAFPDIHVFFVIRNTLDRTWSNIRKNIVKQGIKNPTVEWMIEQASHPKTLSRNDYLRTVKLWHKAYGDRFHVILFDRFVANPLPVMLKIADWLSIDAEFYRQLSTSILNMPINSTPKLNMPPTFMDWFSLNNRFEWDLQVAEIMEITSIN